MAEKVFLGKKTRKRSPQLQAVAQTDRLVQWNIAKSSKYCHQKVTSPL